MIAEEQLLALGCWLFVIKSARCDDQRQSDKEATASSRSSSLCKTYPLFLYLSHGRKVIVNLLSGSHDN